MSVVRSGQVATNQRSRMHDGCRPGREGAESLSTSSSGFLELVLHVLGVGYGRFSYGHISIYWLATMADSKWPLKRL